EIQSRVASGALQVTTLVQVQRFLRREKARTGETYPLEKRRELFHQVQGLSTRQVERELVRISPESALPQERQRALTEEKTELRLVISEALRLQLEELKALYSHQMKDPRSTAELLEILAAKALKKNPTKALRLLRSKWVRGGSPQP